MLGKDICLTILKISQLGNFYLEKNATEQDNQSLFLQVQDFIIKSGRFI